MTARLVFRRVYGEVKGGRGIWHGVNGGGYTDSIMLAGLYPASATIEPLPPEVRPWFEVDAEEALREERDRAVARLHVVDESWLDVRRLNRGAGDHSGPSTALAQDAQEPSVDERLLRVERRLTELVSAPLGLHQQLAEKWQAEDRERSPS